jgi:hypothetical protein
MDEKETGLKIRKAFLYYFTGLSPGKILQQIRYGVYSLFTELIYIGLTQLSKKKAA